MVVISDTKLKINVWMFVRRWKWQREVKMAPRFPSCLVNLHCLRMKDSAFFLLRFLQCMFFMHILWSYFHIFFLFFIIMILFFTSLLSFVSSRCNLFQCFIERSILRILLVANCALILSLNVLLIHLVFQELLALVSPLN